MTEGRPTDLRPALRLARDTWDRAGPDGRRRLVLEAARMGYRLVVVAPDGDVHEPGPDIEDW